MLLNCLPDVEAHEVLERLPGGGGGRGEEPLALVQPESRLDLLEDDRVGDQVLRGQRRRRGRLGKQAHVVLQACLLRPGPYLILEKQGSFKRNAKYVLLFSCRFADFADFFSFL